MMCCVAQSLVFHSPTFPLFLSSSPLFLFPLLSFLIFSPPAAPPLPCASIPQAPKLDMSFDNISFALSRARTPPPESLPPTPMATPYHSQPTSPASSRGPSPFGMGIVNADSFADLDADELLRHMLESSTLPTGMSAPEMRPHVPHHNELLGMELDGPLALDDGLFGDGLLAPANSPTPFFDAEVNAHLDALDSVAETTPAKRAPAEAVAEDVAAATTTATTTAAGRRRASARRATTTAKAKANAANTAPASSLSTSAASTTTSSATAQSGSTRRTSRRATPAAAAAPATPAPATPAAMDEEEDESPASPDSYSASDAGSAPASKRAKGEKGASVAANKRESHNTSERQRRMALKRSFDDLRCLVPAVAGEARIHTGQILKASLLYVQELQREEEALLAAKAKLRAENRALKARLG